MVRLYIYANDCMMYICIIYLVLQCIDLSMDWVSRRGGSCRCPVQVPVYEMGLMIFREKVWCDHWVMNGRFSYIPSGHSPETWAKKDMICIYIYIYTYD